jgi:ABC-type phosphate/phosphonate transport system substrate-binding protein
MCGLAVALVVVSGALGQQPAPNPPPNPPPVASEVRIGFPKALFKDVSQPLINAAAKPFQRMIQKETGLDGKFEIAPDYAALAAGFKNGTVDIAVFHGFEYAWVKHQPEMIPVVITAPSCGKVQACLVVHADSKAKTVQELKGACVAVPHGSKAHCQMFLEWLRDKEKVKEGDCCPASFPKGELPTPDEALDAVVAKKCEAALVDISSLITYRAFKQGLSKSLKVLAESEELPSAVVVCRKGALTNEQVGKVRDGLLNCNKTAIGRTFTLFWQLDGFKEVTPAYNQALERTLKSYPPPAESSGVIPIGQK